MNLTAGFWYSFRRHALIAEQSPRPYALGPETKKAPEVLFYLSRLSLLTAMRVPTDWKICTSTISRITAISMIRNL